MTLNSLTITNGYDTTGNGGGGILNCGTLVVNQSILAGNSLADNSASLGLAPAITGAWATPAYTTVSGSSFTFACHPTPIAGLVPSGGAQAGILLNGFADPAPWQGSTLHDDGGWGDAVAGDGIFSDNSAYFNSLSFRLPPRQKTRSPSLLPSPLFLGCWR